MIRFVCLFALIALATAASLSLDSEWSEFKAKHGKVYSSAEEESTRRAIFANNLKKIQAHNEKADNGIVTYRMGVNKFADMTWEEFSSTRLGYRRSSNKRSAPLIHNVNYTVEAPKSVDWRKKGIVAEIKDQGQCGSCWAFSTIASLEGAHAQKTGKLVELSEEQLVDCSWDYGNEGCDGGLMDNAFKYIKDNKGVDSESSYPYTSGDGEDSRKCKYKKLALAATLSSYVDIPQGDEKALLSAVSQRVVSVAMDAEDDLQFYVSGVFSSEVCEPEALDHGVAVVGYGVENGVQYWIVKNSWGKSWGEEGYFRMVKGKNMCGIAESASYPIV